MKAILFILTLFFLTASAANAQSVCCPEFKLVADMEPCPDSIRQGSPSGHEKKCDLSACKHTTNTYLVLPLKTGYTYTWYITGGTSASATGNPMKVTWGNGDEGSIKIFISNQDGSCRDTITKVVCLKDAPFANFSFVPGSPVCLNQALQFTNTSIGATSYYWDFGDGSSSTQVNPLHNFTAPGTYTIVLAVSNKPPGVKTGGPLQDYGIECGCRDTIRKTITVKNESGINIISGCKKMLCKGDTASYCTTNQCNSYNWRVTGGRILGAANGTCINVVWDGTYPAAVSLSGNCGGTCGNSGTLNVPVIYPSMPIQGNTIVCPSSFTTYTLPSMPGTFYKWQLSGGGMIVGADSNTSVINVMWGTATGNYTITCNYHNPTTGCSGSANIIVQILPPYKIAGPVKFCVGNSFNFTANGNGNWTIMPTIGFTPSSFPTGSSINGIWNNPGNYSITATPTLTSNYCSYPAVLDIVVLDTPKLNSIIGPTLICPGSTQMYSISSNMNNGIFNWPVVGGIVVSYMGAHHDSVMIKWNTTGPIKVVVNQIVEGCASSNKTLMVDVYPPPLITSGPTSACMDNTLTYTASGAAPPSGYNWTLSNALGTIISGQGTNAVTIQWHGALAPASCVVTVTTCGGLDSRTVSIFAAPPVTINKTNTLCSTTGITLTASISGGTSYVWGYNGIVMSPSFNTQSIIITNAGIYTVTITNANGCKSVGSIFIPEENLSVSAYISTTDKTIWYCLETINTTLHAIPSAPGYCYQWYTKQANTTGPGFPISGATSANYIATVDALYWCEISLCNTSCKALTDTIKIIKYGCGGDGNCDPNYTINLTNTACNPFSFTGSTNPSAAAGSVNWYFGDGAEGSGSNSTHQYKDTGSYKVCVVFGNSPYCRKDTCKIIRVTIAANFAATVNCDSVNITNLCKAAVPITSYNWSFPGGIPSSSMQPTPPPISYATGGLHTATVTISDGTCILSYSDTFTTYNVAATINVPSPVCAKTQAPFTATSTNLNLTYQWNFGDGYISNLQNTTHAYANAGNYTVTLIVTDINGCSKIYTQPINVLPEVTASIGTDKFVCPGGTVTLNVTPAFATYQWYKDGVAIPGAITATYSTGVIGEYWVTVANGNGCTAVSNHVNVLFNSLPIADIQADAIKCTANMPISVQNIYNETGVTYSWVATGPSAVSFSPATSYHPTVTIAGSTPGEYQFVLTAVNNITHCISKDTLCITVVKSPTVSVSAPIGLLCEGQVYTFTATASPNISLENYFYQWSNGMLGNTICTGKPGTYFVSVLNPSGCKAMAFGGTIKSRPDVSLFPVGCDTLCLTDTLRFPLPQPASAAYSITWYDDDGTAITNVGNGFVLPLLNLQPGIHHLHATVTFAGGCADTSGTFDLYIKDCTLLPPCNNCTGLFQSASLETNKSTVEASSYQINDNLLTITILKPVKEVRISLADIKYNWKDSTCNNCKVQMIERGCLFAAMANQPLGTLLPDNSAATNVLPGATVTKCPEELVWKNGTLLQPGTYTIPLQLSLSKGAKDKCQLNLEKLCLHLTLIDSLCKTCDTWICKNDKPNDDDCKCNAGNNWTSLYLIPKKLGIPKPKNQILCNSTLTGISSNTPYVLSGVYHCQGSCMSVKNEITVYNQLNQIIYTHVASALNETIQFQSSGMYSVTLTSNCGAQKCICSFKINVTDSVCIDCPPPPCLNCPPPPCIDCPSITEKIDSVIKKILPPDFNGEILIAKNDTVLYEKYVSYKDNVNSHTTFDLASITKTFTSMAILKLMEDGKLNVNDAVSKYLPEFPVPEITIKMLLSHRSGLEDYLKFMDESGWDKTKNVTNKDLLRFIVNNKSKVLINTPGKVFDYSNTNFALLSLIIEKITSQSYKDYLSGTFFIPLQMNDTYVMGLDNFAKATKSYYKNGSVYKLRYLDLIYGDKNVYSTVQDLNKWDKALRKGKLFKKSTLDLAYAPSNPLAPFVSNYGLGWKKLITANGNEIIYHTGWWAGSRSILIRLLKENVIIVVISNNNFTNIADIRKICDLFGDYQQSNKKIVTF